MKKHLKRTFLTGLFILILLVVAIYIIYTVVISISPVIRNLMSDITGTGIYIPGTGFILFIIITCLTGVLASKRIEMKWKEKKSSTF